MQVNPIELNARDEQNKWSSRSTPYLGVFAGEALSWAAELVVASAGNRQIRSRSIKRQVGGGLLVRETQAGIIYTA